MRRSCLCANGGTSSAGLFAVCYEQQWANRPQAALRPCAYRSPTPLAHHAHRHCCGRGMALRLRVRSSTPARTGTPVYRCNESGTKRSGVSQRQRARRAVPRQVRRISQMRRTFAGSPFDRALTEAQRRLRIMPIGIAAAGAWRYAFVYDTCRAIPSTPARTGTLVYRCNESGTKGSGVSRRQRAGRAVPRQVRRISQMHRTFAGSPFDRALTEAQRRLRIMPIGIAAAGTWRYAFVYDTCRAIPSTPARTGTPVYRCNESGTKRSGVSQRQRAGRAVRQVRCISQMRRTFAGSPFDRALTEAQRRLRIMPIGIAAAGAWRYAFVSDLPHLPNRCACLPLQRKRHQEIGSEPEAAGWKGCTTAGATYLPDASHLCRQPLRPCTHRSPTPLAHHGHRHRYGRGMALRLRVRSSTPAEQVRLFTAALEALMACGRACFPVQVEGADAPHAALAALLASPNTQAGRA